MEQLIISAESGYDLLTDFLSKNAVRKVMLIAGESIKKSDAKRYVEETIIQSGVKVVPFDAFHPNPQYESVQEGVRVFRENECGAVLAIGGGSAMDVAKCIKLFSNMDGDGEDGGFLRQEAKENDVKLIVLPTTAGTGSEATRYAVVYYNGEKQSITHDSIVPEVVIKDVAPLRTLPLYHKKATMMDALCHGVESYWSVNSTDESKAYATEAIQLILSNMDGYLDNHDEANECMLHAAHMAGKAINITQTTAGHAMSYKLTGLYGIAHGHAAALCVKELWPWMLTHTDRCIDRRGMAYMDSMFAELARAFSCEKTGEAADCFGKLVDNMAFEPLKADETAFEILKKSVNPVRLKNHPIALDEEAIDLLYRVILI